MGIPRGALAAALVVSCGSPQHAPKQEEPAPKVVTYGPLGIKADAKAPNQAAILGTDDKNGSTLIPLPTAQSRAAVDAMYVKMTPPITGGMTAVKLATAPNPDQSVQVGIVEEFAGGTGPQWRAGVWVSAIVAATTLNKDLTDFTFSASSGGYIDGASASGLMAGGFLAAMTGTPIDPTATMTGTINPDGTIGPVAGIPEKFLGSIDKGKKHLGYPIGMRMAKSEATGELVDLVELAKKHGVEAVEVADVHEAYKLLTGKSLPEPTPVAESEMALDKDTVAALDAKYKEWQTRVGTEWATLVQLENAGRLPPLLSAMRQYAKSYAETAETLHKRGMAGASYSRMLAAWAFASATTQAYDILQKVQSGNIAAAVDEIKALDRLDETTTAVLKKIGTMRPNTLGGHLEMMAAFEAGLRGYVFKQMASMSIAQTAAYLDSLKGVPTAQLGSPEAADKTMSAIAPTLLYVGRTIAESTLATQELEFENEQSVQYMCSLPNVKRMATSFSSAGGAGLNYFDTLLTQPLAEQNHVSEDEARTKIAAFEPDYYVAWITSRLGNGPLDELKAAWGEHSLAWGLLSLAGSELAYYDAAQLIAKYYSLEVHTDDSGKVDKVEHDKAFLHMLAAAERNARTSAHEAKIATGAIPVQAKLAYQLATVERDGDLGDKLDALGEFWASSAFSQTAVMLARN
ncbi:MAG: hypothetical protein JO257_20240 [Deltaproteobacteria bacterium]|nr:hypothetical protein [Deltaproteobacteria bacterium]